MEAEAEVLDHASSKNADPDHVDKKSRAYSRVEFDGEVEKKSSNSTGVVTRSDKNWSVDCHSKVFKSAIGLMAFLSWGAAMQVLPPLFE